MILEGRNRCVRVCELWVCDPCVTVDTAITRLPTPPSQSTHDRPKNYKKKKKLDFIQPPFPRSKVTMMMDNPNTHSQHFQHPELLLDQGFSLHQKHIATCQCQGDLVQPGWGWTCLGLQVPPLLQGVDDPFDPCHIDLVTMAS